LAYALGKKNPGRTTCKSQRNKWEHVLHKANPMEHPQLTKDTRSHYNSTLGIN